MIGNFRTSLLAGLLVLGPMLSHPACAGSWHVTYETQGTITGDANSYDLGAGVYIYPGATPWVTNTTNHDLIYDIGDPYPGHPVNNDISTEGNVTAVFTWSGAAGETPPSSLNVRETASAMTLPGRPDVGAILNLDDGLGDPIVQGDGDTTRSGSHLSRIATNGQSMVRLPMRHLLASISYPNRESLNMDGLVEEISVSYSAVEDNRNITLHRAGAVGEVVDPDGNTHGDTTYSYYQNLYSELGGQDQIDYYNWQTFNAIYFGNWSQKTHYNSSGQISGTEPNVAWSWTPNESADTVDTGLWEVPFGNIYYDANGNAIGTHDPVLTKNIVYSAKDLHDGVSKTCTYYLNVHDQWDNLRPDISQPDTEHLRYYYAKLPDNSQLWVAGPAASATMTVTITGTVTLSGTFTRTFKASDALTFGLTVGGQISVAVAGAFAVAAPALLDRQHTTPYAQCRWVTNHYLVDHYTPAGFDGTAPQAIDDPNSKAITFGWTPASPIDDFDFPLDQN